MKKLSLMLVVAVVGFVGFAGSVIEWDSTKTTGNWSDGDNWFGGTAPTGLDAAKFTLNGASWTVDIASEVSVTNLWVEGPGTLHLRMQESAKVVVCGNMTTTAVYPTIGNGRQSLYVFNGANLVIDGGEVASNGTGNYHDAQFTAGTSLVVTNGGAYAMSTRAPGVGARNPSNDGKVVFKVIGDGSTMDLASGQFCGTGCRYIAENGGKLMGPIAVKGTPTDMLIVVTNGSSYVAAKSNQDITFNDAQRVVVTDNSSCTGYSKLYMSGVSGTPPLVLDGGSKYAGSNGLELSNAENLMFVMHDTDPSIETFNTTTVRWGMQKCTNCTFLVTNAYAKITGYFTLGAHSGSATANRSKGMKFIVAKGGKVTFSGSTQNLELGKHSDDDIFFVDDGVVDITASRDDQPTKIGSDDCTGTVLKLCGENAQITSKAPIIFGNGATFVLELPLATDRDLVKTTNAVTINDGTKFEITVPEPVAEKQQYTILTGGSITGMIGPADVSVKGEAKATLSKSADEKSLILTLRPKSASGMIVICR